MPRGSTDDASTRFGTGLRANRARPLRAGARLGKYRIVRRIAEGGFSMVYEALDEIEGLRVALKVPRPDLITADVLDQFRREVRTHAALDHGNVLPIRNADRLGGVLVIAVPLGETSLQARMKRRLGTEKALAYTRQAIAGLAHVHAHRIVHCDVKPENLLLFPGDRLRLADFGIAKVVRPGFRGSGSGTLGYMAPEQAMGHPSFRADVFSLGLVLWELWTGALPEYPFRWPYPGHDRLRRRVPAEFVEFLRRATDPDPKRRFRDAGSMEKAFARIEPRVLRKLRGERSRRSGSRPSDTDWKQVRFRQFRRRFRTALGLDRDCGTCGGPMSEAMQCCPWCAAEADPHAHDTTFPARCDRCGRGRKLDWPSCAWCWGPKFVDVSQRSFDDARYTAKCGSCSGRLMPWMRYCPWCRTKVRRRWTFDGAVGRCGGCGNGVVRGEWRHCPWCTKRLPDA